MEGLIYQASLEGNLTLLHSLLQKDPLILDKVTLNQHNDMPLHIACMRGHTEFVNEILTQNPKLAMRYDSQRRLPLHIASTIGHLEIVKALLSANPETCSVRDRDEMNPLHLGAINGHCEVVKELVQTQPHAARAMVEEDTILHLCVKHNQLEVLKVLVETIGDHEFVNTKDDDGNTILHLAVADKQTKTVKFLLLDTTIEVEALNKKGETSMVLLAQGPRDMKDQKIIGLLTRAGLENEDMIQHNPQNSTRNIGVETMVRHVKRDSKKSDEEWLEKMRNSLMIVASLIATMAFTAGISPPCGVWQDTDEDHEAGQAIMPTVSEKYYRIFLVSNTIGFVSTISIIFLLISELPFMKRRTFMIVLKIVMWIATAATAMTYLVSMLTIIPKGTGRTFKPLIIVIIVSLIGGVTHIVLKHSLQVAIHGFDKYLRQKLGLPGKRNVLAET